MKGKLILCVSALVILASSACKTKNRNSKTEAMVEKNCYRLVSGQDTVDLSIRIIGDSVVGNLKFNMFEKDDSEGIIKGKLTDSIILAEYTFVAEGKESNVNEVIFMLKPDAVIQGYGEMVEKDDKYVFSDSAQINFASILQKVNCKD